MIEDLPCCAITTTSVVVYVDVLLSGVCDCVLLGVLVGVIVTVVIPLPCDNGVAVTVVVLIPSPLPLVFDVVVEVEVDDVELVVLFDVVEELDDEGDTVVDTTEVRIPGCPD